MFFFQFQRSFLQPPTTEIVGSCYRTSNGLLEEVGSEFISSLQPRKKLQDAQPNLKEDDIVLIKGRSSWYMANGSSSSSASRQRRTGSCCNCENQDSVFKRPVHKLPIYPN
ncbi:hypothetical protein TNCV_305911 [Trichonephila clavipes]|nr:hypothetical protein TNCV_305911 [Trichonephila clavipes]